EGTRENPCRQQATENRGCVIARRQAKKARAPDTAPSISVEQIVEPRGLLAEPRAHGLHPIDVRERICADRDCRTADRPGAEDRPQSYDDFLRGDREAETKSGQPECFSEGAKHERAGGGKNGRKTLPFGVKIGKGFVHDQNPASRLEL